MNPEINEVILRSKPNREPMPFERLKFICCFIAGLVAEILGFGLAFVVVLEMGGVLH